VEIWGGIGRRMKGLFSGMLRGVSRPRGGSEILTFLFRHRLVCTSLLDLRSSWKVNSANYFAMTELSEACSLASTRNPHVIEKVFVQTMQQIRLALMLYSNTARNSVSARVRTS
jgi:hypothetical protein